MLHIRVLKNSIVLSIFLALSHLAGTVKSQNSEFYVSFPLALAAAIGIEPGETVQWELLDRGELHLVRPEVRPPTTRRRASKK